MKISVIAGGTSDEREVSLRSGRAVSAALERAGHNTTLHDPSTGQLTRESVMGYDAAFPIIHGKGGEDGTLQQQLETLGIPYVGSGIESCRLPFDKSAYKRLLDARDILTPKGDITNTTGLRQHELVRKPFVLKPYDGGSSVDTFIVRDVHDAPWDDMQKALEKYGDMLIEELISGSEITVGVLDDQALPIIEIIPPADGEFDYQNKYNGATQELCPPEHVSEDTQARAQRLAENIHKLCGCRDLSRTDMIITDAGELFVLETNTLPGMTDQSLLPKAAKVAGYDMTKLCDHLVRLAKDRGTDDA